MNVKQIPNVISILRLMLVPGFALVLLEQQFDSALALFLLMGVSDGLDGFLARRLHAESALGEVLDPLADKIMLMTGFILLGHLELLPTWLVVLAVGRDVLVSGGALLLRLYRPEMSLQAAPIGKANTFFEISLLLCVMLSQLLDIPQSLFDVLYVLAALLIVSSGLWYLFQWTRVQGPETPG